MIPFFLRQNVFMYSNWSEPRGKVKLELQITSYEFKSSELRVQIHELRVQIYELPVQIHEL